MTPLESRVIEAMCVNEIQSPTGICSGRLPFTRTGELTAHHCVNFAKVYGKYVLSQKYQGDALETLCQILDLLRLCLSSTLTPDVLSRVRVSARQVATLFSRFLPDTEKAIIFHLFVFHVPDTLAEWGPCRGYWCFPYERMIGWLARAATQPNQPELTIIRRYMQSVDTFRNIFSRRTQEEELLDRGEHPLVPVDAVHSYADQHRVFYPGLTKHNSRYADVGTSHVRDKFLKPMFGTAVADANIGNGSNLLIRTFDGAVQIGLWKYRCQAREDNCLVRRARSSWFRIKAKHVPLFVEQFASMHLYGADAALPYDPEEMLYGRFVRFMHVQVTDWIIHAGSVNQPILLGDCRLYRRLNDARAAGERQPAGLVCIDIEQPLCYNDPRKANRIHATTTRIRYVQLIHVEGMLAVGPQYAQSIHTDDQQKASTTTRWCVMELQV